MAGMSKDFFATMARHAQWANRRIYAACAQLGYAEYRKSRPAFFGSIHATLNHQLGADLNWLARFRDDYERPPFAFTEILHNDFPALRERREREDAGVVAYVDDLSEAALGEDLNFKLLDGSWHAKRFDILLGNFFNHQTHHRAQVHDMLAQTTVPPPPLDVLPFLLGR